MFHHVSRGDTTLLQVSGTRTASSRSGTEARTGQLGPNRLGPASNQCLRGVLKNHAYLLWWINVYIYRHIIYIYICGLSYVSIISMYVFEDNYSCHVDRYNNLGRKNNHNISKGRPSSPQSWHRDTLRRRRKTRSWPRPTRRKRKRRFFGGSVGYNQPGKQTKKLLKMVIYSGLSY